MNFWKKFAYKVYEEQEYYIGNTKINNSLFQVLLARRMGRTHLICESGAGQHFSATAAEAIGSE